MIDQIQLIRFKRFGELSITSQQLTVLTGTNGSGKTSVIHALLLARQTGDRTSAVVQLNFGGIPNYSATSTAFISCTTATQTPSSSVCSATTVICRGKPPLTRRLAARHFIAYFAVEPGETRFVWPAGGIREQLTRIWQRPPVHR